MSHAVPSTRPRSRWTVTTEGGDSYEADALVLATGQLNRPSIPRLPGSERFAGHTFHSARWDHDYELAGRRVAVIGTGASAVQFVPPVAQQAAHLTVFQRTGNWMLPRENRVYPRWAPADRAVPPINWVRRRYLFDYCELLAAKVDQGRGRGSAVRVTGAGGAAAWPEARTARRRKARVVFMGELRGQGPKGLQEGLQGRARTKDENAPASAAFLVLGPLGP